jgi:catechol 2,3-dioxygenase-like lactoylglutathione lyase family enzyme
MGFETSVDEENPQIVFFNSRGTKLAIYPLDELAMDINPKNPPTGQGFSGITLAYNARSTEEVDKILQKAEMAGGRIEKYAQKVFWGGYSGYFCDPDGYFWEVAYWEGWKFDENEMIIVE